MFSLSLPFCADDLQCPLGLWINTALLSLHFSCPSCERLVRRLNIHSPSPGTGAALVVAVAHGNSRALMARLVRGTTAHGATFLLTTRTEYTYKCINSYTSSFTQSDAHFYCCLLPHFHTNPRSPVQKEHCLFF